MKRKFNERLLSILNTKVSYLTFIQMSRFICAKLLASFINNCQDLSKVIFLNSNELFGVKHIPIEFHSYITNINDLS